MQRFNWMLVSAGAASVTGLNRPVLFFFEYLWIHSVIFILMKNKGGTAVWVSSKKSWNH